MSHLITLCQDSWDPAQSPWEDAPARILALSLGSRSALLFSFTGLRRSRVLHEMGDLVSIWAMTIEDGEDGEGVLPGASARLISHASPDRVLTDTAANKRSIFRAHQVS